MVMDFLNCERREGRTKIFDTEPVTCIPLNGYSTKKTIFITGQRITRMIVHFEVPRDFQAKPSNIYWPDGIHGGGKIQAILGYYIFQIISKDCF